MSLRGIREWSGPNCPTTDHLLHSPHSFRPSGFVLVKGEMKTQAGVDKNSMAFFPVVPTCGILCFLANPHTKALASSTGRP